MSDRRNLCGQQDFKGGFGTNNVDGNPRLCMASAVGGYTTTFGKDEPMGTYADIDRASTFFIIAPTLRKRTPSSSAVSPAASKTNPA